MFKPVEFYYKKKSGKGDSKQELYKKWFKLSDKKLKKFIKKAEKQYDEAVQVINFILLKRNNMIYFIKILGKYRPTIIHYIFKQTRS